MSSTVLTKPAKLAVLLGVLAVLASCKADRPAPPPVPKGLAGIAWMADDWECFTPQGYVEEHWSEPLGGTMVGFGRIVVDDKTVFHEYLRIEEDEQGLRYVANPMGGPSTVFRMTEQEPDSVTFENPGNDYPRVIRYWTTDGIVLHARIEGVENGKPASEEWGFRTIQQSTRAAARMATRRRWSNP